MRGAPFTPSPSQNETESPPSARGAGAPVWALPPRYPVLPRAQRGSLPHAPSARPRRRETTGTMKALIMVKKRKNRRREIERSWRDRQQLNCRHPVPLLSDSPSRRPFFCCYAHLRVQLRKMWQVFRGSPVDEGSASHEMSARVVPDGQVGPRKSDPANGRGGGVDFQGVRILHYGLPQRRLQGVRPEGIGRGHPGGDGWRGFCYC